MGFTVEGRHLMKR